MLESNQPESGVQVVDEYDFDSSDEEDIRNTVGNIPLHWYSKFSHIGYDTSGRPIQRPAGANLDAIDALLASEDQADSWRTVRDPTTGQPVVLSEEDIRLVRSIAAGKAIVGPGEEGPFQPSIDWFTQDVMVTPLTAQPPHKRSFIPSKFDKRRVGRMVYAMKMGWMQPPAARPDEDEWDDSRPLPTVDEEAEAMAQRDFPDVWAEPDQEAANNEWLPPLLLPGYRPSRPRPYTALPPRALPGHSESYNPPPEYLLSKEEEKSVKQAWRETHGPRSKPPLPRHFACLRQVPWSTDHVFDMWEKTRDILNAPRVERQRVSTTPDHILPKLPALSDLRPFPQRTEHVYRGHQGSVSSVSVSPCGLWLASASAEDGTLRIWEAAGQYCFRCYQLDRPSETGTGAGRAIVAWNPLPGIHLVAVAMRETVHLINPALTNTVVVDKTVQLVAAWDAARKQRENADSPPDDMERASDEESEDKPSAKRRKLSKPGKSFADWSVVEAASTETPVLARERCRIVVKLQQAASYLSWHPFGDYLVTVTSCPGAAGPRASLLLHRLSLMQTQAPLLAGSSTGWSMAAFSPRQSHVLYVANQREVHVFDLTLRKLVRTLKTGVNSTSAFRVHPSGDHLIVGSHEGRFEWFDMDMGTSSFKQLKLEHGSVSWQDIHSSRPLVANAMEDGHVVLLHGRVSSDLLEPPVIVPLQIIKAHPNCRTLSCTFHPCDPFLYTSGSDHLIKLFIPWH